MRIINRKQIRESRIKPVYLMNQPGVTDLERKAVIDGSRALIKLADVSGIDFIDFGEFRNKNYRNPDNSLKDFQSVDWYIERGRQTSRNNKQLNGNTMMDDLFVEPWRDEAKGGRDHYDIFIINEDFYLGDTNFVIGVARQGIGTIISTDQFKQLDDRARYECIKTETIHELGHVFGLIPNSRTENIEENLGKHCTNVCSMRQGLVLPTDWINFTNDRLRYGPLCSQCTSDLREYFK